MLRRYKCHFGMPSLPREVVWDTFSLQRHVCNAGDSDIAYIRYMGLAEHGAYRVLLDITQAFQQAFFSLFQPSQAFTSDLRLKLGFSPIDNHPQTSLSSTCLVPSLGEIHHQAKLF